MRCHGPAAFLGLFVALLAACDREPTAPAPASTTQAPAPAAPATATGSTPADTGASAAQACPDADFDAFLKRFESSADVQRAATADPLVMSRIDRDAEPEPAPVTRQVAKGDVEFPVLADSATRQAEGSALLVRDMLAKTERVVVVARPGTDAQVRLVFNAMPCWTLTAVHDESL